MSYCLSFNTSEEGADRVRGRGDEGRKGVRGWEEREEGGGGREKRAGEGKIGGKKRKILLGAPLR